MLQKGLPKVFLDPASYDSQSYSFEPHTGSTIIMPTILPTLNSLSSSAKATTLDGTCPSNAVSAANGSGPRATSTKEHEAECPEDPTEYLTTTIDPSKLYVWPGIFETEELWGGKTTRQVCWTAAPTGKSELESSLVFNLREGAYHLCDREVTEWREIWDGERDPTAFRTTIRPSRVAKTVTVKEYQTEILEMIRKQGTVWNLEDMSLVQLATPAQARQLWFGEGAGDIISSATTGTELILNVKGICAPDAPERAEIKSEHTTV